MGRNGSGKSTLMWALQGSRKRAGGTVRVAGRDPEALPAEERRRLVGLVPQTAADLLYLETVTQECAAADAEAGAEAGYGATGCSTGSSPASTPTGTRATSPRGSGWPWCSRSCSPPSRR